jgi:hypothetical protein
MALPPHWGPWPIIQFRNHFSQTVGLFGREISPSQGIYLNTGQYRHRINAYTHHTSMPWVGFEPRILASERAKTLNRVATVSGFAVLESQNFFKSGLTLKKLQFKLQIQDKSKTSKWTAGGGGLCACKSVDRRNTSSWLNIYLSSVIMCPIYIMNECSPRYKYVPAFGN